MKPIMTIKAPRGKCRIFPFEFETLLDYLCWRYRHLSIRELDKALANPTEEHVNTYSYHRYKDLQRKARCVKAFMKGVGKLNGNSSRRPRKHTAKAH